MTVGTKIATGGLGRGANAVRVADELEDAAKVSQKVLKKIGMEAVSVGDETSQLLLRTEKQLQAKFKHATDFGVHGNYSKGKVATLAKRSIGTSTVLPCGRFKAHTISKH